MQLNITTDYAICVIIYLGNSSESRTAKEIADELCIPQNYLVKVLTKLRKGGIVTSVSGYAGGYQLKREFSTILLGEVFEIMENTMMINKCLEAGSLCYRHAEERCAMHKFYNDFQKDMEKRWLSVPLKDIVDRYKIKNMAISG